jgi:hypothetical protein
VDPRVILWLEGRQGSVELQGQIFEAKTGGKNVMRRKGDEKNIFEEEG